MPRPRTLQRSSGWSAARQKPRQREKQVQLLGSERNRYSSRVDTQLLHATPRPRLRPRPWRSRAAAAARAAAANGQCRRSRDDCSEVQLQLQPQLQLQVHQQQLHPHLQLQLQWRLLLPQLQMVLCHRESVTDACRWVQALSQVKSGETGPHTCRSNVQLRSTWCRSADRQHRPGLQRCNARCHRCLGVTASANCLHDTSQPTPLRCNPKVALLPCSQDSSPFCFGRPHH